MANDFVYALIEEKQTSARLSRRRIISVASSIVKMGSTCSALKKMELNATKNIDKIGKLWRRAACLIPCC